MTSADRAPRVVVAYGTRPERIKLAPLAASLREVGVEVDEWKSGQHALDDTHRHPAWDSSVTMGIAVTMCRFDAALQRLRPDVVIVQGDTASAFACAQAAFLAGIPVAHVEAGLRTYRDEPWPEEAFRCQIGAIAKWHFCPDSDAERNLARETAYSARTFVVGNTVIDTLPKKRFGVLATLHRRENWGERRQSALETLLGFSESAEDVVVDVIRHPNGNLDYSAIIGIDDILTPPMPHAEFLRRVADADLIVTDSGGLQEEAAHFGVPVLVLRTSTERTALERTGAVTLIDPDDPFALREALDAAHARRRCYGTGDASAKIADILLRELAK